MTATSRKSQITILRAATLVLAGVAFLPQACGQEKSVLSERFVLDPIRVFYAVEGVSAVPPADSNSNGVPDHVEDVAKQVWAAHRLFCEVLGFPDPLKSERYPGVTCIQVFLRDRAEIGGVNGVAFDESQRARLIPEGKPDDRAIVIAVASQVVAPRNGTPAHELFHLIQYGATYFKKGWYLEGQARWSEHALAASGLGDVKYPPRGPWPQPPNDLPTLYAMGYDSEFVLWNPIALGTDPKGLLPQTPALVELANLRYSDGSPVLKDLHLTGFDVMREILIELGKMDDIAFAELGYDKWTEDNQNSPQNDGYIYQAIMDVLRRRSRTVGRFQVTKSATFSPVRTPAPEVRNEERIDTEASSSARAEPNSTAIEAAKWRTWTTADGKYRLEAKFLKYASGTLTLEKREGTTVDLKLDVLCTDDQDFVRKRKWMNVGNDN